MKKVQITREVFRTKMHGFDGYAIMSPEGELDKFYPALIREPETIGCADTAEISTEFFLYIAMLQSRGVAKAYPKYSAECAAQSAQDTF